MMITDITGYDEEKKILTIGNDWDPTTAFSNTEIAEIFYRVPDYFSVYFTFDISFPEKHIPVICIIPKGSAEMAYIQCFESFVRPKYAMNLSANELFDPKDEGIIYIQEDTHDQLVEVMEKIMEILASRRRRISEEDK